MQASNPMAARGADKHIDKFENTFQSSTQFFTTVSPDQVEAQLEQFLKSNGCEVNKNEAKYRFDFTFNGAA
jgi:hypothetical protein